MSHVYGKEFSTNQNNLHSYNIKKYWLQSISIKLSEISMVDIRGCFWSNI